MDSSSRARQTSYVALTKSPADFSKVLPSSIGKASSLQVRIHYERFFSLFDVTDLWLLLLILNSKGVRYYTPWRPIYTRCLTKTRTSICSCMVCPTRKRERRSSVSLKSLRIKKGANRPRRNRASWERNTRWHLFLRFLIETSLSFCVSTTTRRKWCSVLM